MEANWFNDIMNSPFLWILVGIVVIFWLWNYFSRIKKLTIINKERMLGEELYKSNKYNPVDVGYVFRNGKPVFRIEAMSFYTISKVKTYKINVQPLLWWVLPNPFSKSLIFIVGADKFVLKGKNVVLNNDFSLENRFRLLYNLSDENARRLLNMYNDIMDIEMLKNGFLAQIQKNAIVTLSSHLKEAQRYEEKEFDSSALKEEVSSRAGNVEREYSE